MRLVIRGSSFAMSFGSANLSRPPLQTAIGVLIFSISYTGGVDCKKGRRPEWVLLYQKLCLEKGFCASICFSFLRSLQCNSRDEGCPLSVYFPYPVPCLLWQGAIHPILCLSVMHGYELSCSLTPACALQRWGHGKSRVCVYQARAVECIHVYI